MSQFKALMAQTRQLSAGVFKFGAVLYKGKAEEVVKLFCECEDYDFHEWAKSMDYKLPVSQPSTHAIEGGPLLEVIYNAAEDWLHVIIDGAEVSLSREHWHTLCQFVQGVVIKEGAACTSDTDRKPFTCPDCGEKAGQHTEECDAQAKASGKLKLNVIDTNGAADVTRLIGCDYAVYSRAAAHFSVEKPVTFEIDRTNPPGDPYFISAIPKCNSRYLRLGAFSQASYLKEFCRPATPEEVIDYRKLKEVSVYAPAVPERDTYDENAVNELCRLEATEALYEDTRATINRGIKKGRTKEIRHLLHSYDVNYYKDLPEEQYVEFKEKLDALLA